MSAFHLIIGNKNYSSWSLRGWLAMRHVGEPFEETLIPLDESDTHREILRHSPSGKVPCLLHDGRAIWDSLAICEYLHELFPAARLWPEDRKARAHARSVSAEMHSGFSALRASMPMNIRRKPGTLDIGEAERADIVRICAIWRDCHNSYNDSDDQGFLFGAFSAADIMFAPVVWRFYSYGVDLPETCAAYARNLREMPSMTEWADAARDEPWVIEREER